MADRLLVDFGGVGRNRPDKYVTVNIGNDLRAAPDIIADVTARANQLPAHFEDYSINAARCIHVLEHIASDDIIPTLHLWRRLMAPSAELLIVVPDMGKMAIDYADGIIPFEVFAAVAYVPGSRVGDRPEEIHRWAFDVTSLEWTMRQAGYNNVRHGGDLDWPANWLFDMEELHYTGLIGNYLVPNLRIIGGA